MNAALTVIYMGVDGRDVIVVILMNGYAKSIGP